MDDQRPSPSSSSSSSSIAVAGRCRRTRRHAAEEDGGDPAAACTGNSCQSCTAGVIADCVAMCCCPCAVVNILALAFVRLPWAVARRCLGGRRKSRRRRLEEAAKRGCCGGEGDTDGISEKGREGDVTSGVVIGGGFGLNELNDHFGAEFKAEDVWLELYEVGHLGFGRVSFTGLPFQNKGN